MPEVLKHLGAFALAALLSCGGAVAQAPTTVEAVAPPAPMAPEPAAIDPDSGEAWRIGLLTIAPGSVYWQRFGHNAILVENTVHGEAIAYNFGTFDFEQENFLLNFLRGRMLYRLSAGDPGRELAGYVADGRGVTLAWLDLSPEQRYAVAEMLAENALPENAEYRYDYFADNCSTRVRDVIDRVLSGQGREQLRGRSEGATYRQLALRYGRAEPWMAIGMDLGLGRRADQPLSFWQQSFIPEQFERFARELDNPETGRPLVADLETLHAVDAAPAQDAGWNWPWLLLVALLVAGLWIRATADGSATRSLAALVAIIGQVVVATIGCGLAGLMFLSEHSMAAANENLLLFAPTALLLVPALWRLRSGEPRGGVVMAWLGLSLALLALLLKLDPDAQANGNWLAVMLPWHAAIWYRVARPMD